MQQLVCVVLEGVERGEVGGGAISHVRVGSEDGVDGG